MMPIVVTYPRTGSELVTAMISNYAKQVWGSGDNLDEFLLVTFLRKFDYRVENGKIEGSNKPLPPAEWQKFNYAGVFKEVDRRIAMLKQDPRHVFKLISTPWLSQAQWQWCLSTYSPIFLERRDRVQSMLSYVLSQYIGMHHTGKHREVKTVWFDLKVAELWVRTFDIYSALPKNGPTVVFEDIFDEGQPSERLLLQKLGWTIPEGYKLLQPSTIATPYERTIRRYFSNTHHIDQFIHQNWRIFRNSDGTPSQNSSGPVTVQRPLPSDC